MDSDIEQFTSITGSTADKASQYLRVTDGSLEQAIQLYFESGGIDLEGSAPSRPAGSTQPQSEAREFPVNSGRADRHGVIHLDSDEDAVDDDAMTAHAMASTRGTASGVSAAIDDDEAMARRLQEELYAGGNQSNDFDSEGVRAPIARTTETLVGPGADWERNDQIDAAIEAQLAARRRPGRAGIFNQRPVTASVWENDTIDPNLRRHELARATGGASEVSSKASALAEMYRPPYELISQNTWEEARDEGKEDMKWILVNVQDAAVFDCQVLNRDIWKNPQVMATVKENFIFMQYDKMDQRGSQYMQYYFQDRDNQEAYPHIAIVDPRTGEQVKVWTGPPAPKPMDFLMQLHEFLDRFSLAANARNPVPVRRAAKKAINMDSLTEDEMLELALKNSMNPGSGPTDESALADQTRSVKGKEKQGTHSMDADMMDTGSIDVKMSGSGAIPLVSPFSLVSSSDPHTEPGPNVPNTTRIQFRHSGGRIIRRFVLSDPVRRIYEWLKAEPFEGRAGVEFELVCMGRNLMDQIEDTIEAAGLKNQTVMIEFLEES